VKEDAQNMHHWSGRTETATENGVGKLDHVVRAAAIRQWRRRQLQISDECFAHLLLQYFPNAVINGIQNWRVWRIQSRWDQFCSFFL